LILGYQTEQFVSVPSQVRKNRWSSWLSSTKTVMFSRGLPSISLGVSREIIEHRLQVNPNVKPKKMKLRKMSEEKIEAVKAEVQRLLDACFIWEVAYPQWLANVVMVMKKNGK
jgi:hypothetical protein